jgi:16S rRNA (adenine1518-N6/adenine1519-N6)-dimethyltransferase
VADRIIAQPGSSAYGRLAILAQWTCEARRVFDLPPSAFTPPPKVTSTVVHLTRLAEPRYPANPKTLSQITAAGFNQRRKMLRSSLKSLHPNIEELLQSSGIAPTERAERVSLEGFCALARALDAARKG